MQKLEKLFLDTEKGILTVNGEEIKNVTAFSLAFKDGEYGLEVTRSDIYTSKVDDSQFFVNLLPDKVFDERSSD